MATGLLVLTVPFITGAYWTIRGASPRVVSIRVPVQPGKGRIDRGRSVGDVRPAAVQPGVEVVGEQVVTGIPGRQVAEAEGAAGGHAIQYGQAPAPDPVHVHAPAAGPDVGVVQVQEVVAARHIRDGEGAGGAVVDGLGHAAIGHDGLEHGRLPGRWRRRGDGAGPGIEDQVGDEEAARSHRRGSCRHRHGVRHREGTVAELVGERRSGGDLDLQVAMVDARHGQRLPLQDQRVGVAGALDEGRGRRMGEDGTRVLDADIDRLPGQAVQVARGLHRDGLVRQRVACDHRGLDGGGADQGQGHAGRRGCRAAAPAAAAEGQAEGQAGRGQGRLP